MAKNSFIIFLVVYSWLLSTAQGLERSLYACNETQDFFSIPNIPDNYFNQSVVAELRTGGNAILTGTGRFLSYLVTLPVECSGYVQAMETCYQIKDGTYHSSQYIRFQVLARKDSTYTTIESFDITSTPTIASCARTDNLYQPNQIVCCERVPLEAKSYFFISSGSNFTYGVTFLNNSNLRMLRFSEIFLHMQHRLKETLQEVVNVSDLNRITSISTLLLLRLIVASENLQETATQSTTEIVSSNLSSSSSKALGLALGTTAAIVMLLSVVLLLCALFFLMKLKKKKKNIDVAINLDNAVYGKDYLECGPSSDKLVEGLMLEREEKCSEQNSGNRIYDEPGQFEARHIEGYEVEVCEYMVPARNESTLYRQFDALRLLRIPRKSVRLGNTLGSGQFGLVCQGWYDEATRVAVKTLKEGAGADARVKFLQEAAIMGQFKHPNVVTMHGVVTEGEPVLIVLELLLKGDLRGFLLDSKTERNVTNLDGHTLLAFCHQVASGMMYLSGKGFVHRDLAARNILVTDENICKIADFGMSRDLMDESYYTSHGGMIPVKWTAPEALHYKKYSSSSDVWSFGMVMYEIWSIGHKPFESLTNNQVIPVLDKGFRLPPPPGCPRKIYHIMIECWHPMAHERPSFMYLRKQLSLSDAILLHWSIQDKPADPEASLLGGNLLPSEHLYKDLQNVYHHIKHC